MALDTYTDHFSERTHHIRRKARLAESAAFLVEALNSLNGFPDLEEQAARLLGAVQRRHLCLAEIWGCQLRQGELASD